MYSSFQPICLRRFNSLKLRTRKYLHYGFGNNTLTLADNFGTGTSFAINTKHDVDTITGRISSICSRSTELANRT